MMKIKNLSFARNLFAARLMSGFVLPLLLVVLLGPAAAQQKISENPPATASTPSATDSVISIAQVDERYRIGPGDVLDIRVFNRPQLSRDAVRVGSNGMIQMPLLENDIRAACLSENELSVEIATLYKKYQRNPYVNVFIKEYSSTPVAVMGAVVKPGRFQLTRRVRLLELLAYAGGPTDKAGGKIQIAHTGSTFSCDPVESASTGVFDFYSLREAMEGGREANPFIQPGDIISIPEADQAYVIGNVFKPSAVLLKDPVTVSQAIAMAGGTLRATKMSGIRIVRPVKGGTTKNVIPIDLNAINKQRAQDIMLEPNDVVEVPTDAGKILRDKIFDGLTGGLSALIYRL